MTIDPSSSPFLQRTGPTRPPARPATAEATSERARVEKGRSYGEVESVKAVSDLIAPLSGEVIEVNEKVTGAPETVNEDPYGEGWLIRIQLSDPSERDALLDVDAYRTAVTES